MYNIHEGYEQKRPLTQGHEGLGVRRARANQMLMVSKFNNQILISNVFSTGLEQWSPEQRQSC